MNAAKVIARCYVFDLMLVEQINRLSARQGVKAFFAVVSHIGDGPFWYGLILLLPVFFGATALAVSLRMVLAGVIGLLMYKWIKSMTERLRPYAVSPSIRLGAEPLDQYSFPSGHTLHAVSFSLLAVYHFPVLAWLLIPLACLIAASRVILGLHYPTDVLAGALIGAALAMLLIAI